MNERGGFYRILQVGPFYSLYQSAIGAKKMREILVCKHIHPERGQRILDLGCGMAEILHHLPDYCEYYGCDPNPNYIDMAKRRNAGKGIFWVAGFDTEGKLELPKDLPDIDIVICMNVIHHINDQQAAGLFEIASKVLVRNCKDNSRLVVSDNCLTEPQNWFARWLIKKDRGKFIRADKWYLSAFLSRFNTVKSCIRTDLFNIPYTFIILEGVLKPHSSLESPIQEITLTKGNNS